MESREQRIATLATTLKSSGIAKSDSQARMMAEDMIGVEEHVQRDYEVEHARAHEYLQTTKNLGAPRQIIKPESKIEAKQEHSAQDVQEPSKRFEELYTSGAVSNIKRVSNTENIDANFGGKTLNQAFDHDTHNSALEAIKTQVSQTTRVVNSESVHNNDLPVPDSIFHKDIEIIPAETLDISNSSKLSDMESLDAPEAPKFSESKPILVDTPAKELPQETPVEEPKLDAKRLLDLMEEDGKLEEHTREIKEKPKDVKPKEAYEENNIDLGNMFDFNKGTMRK